MDDPILWTNQPLPDAIKARLTDAADGYRVVFAASAAASNLHAGASDPQARAATILHGQPDPADVLAAPDLKWVQLTSAGYTRYDDLAFFKALRDRGVAFCNASSLYDEPCAQHCLALLLAMARGLPGAAVDGLSGKWEHRPTRDRSFLLRRQKTLIVGYGAIGQRLAELLSPLGLPVVAFRRTVRGDETVRTLAIDEIDTHLPTAQIVFNLLPASASTRGFFDAARLAKLPADAVYISIGRGDTTDQAALRDALNNGRLAQAFLDVTTPEPLPPNDPLWTTPNCHITPHTAGGTFDEPNRMAEHFLENLRRFTKGEAMLDRIV